MRKPASFRLRLQTFDALDELVVLIARWTKSKKGWVGKRSETRTHALEWAVAGALEMMRKRVKSI